MKTISKVINKKSVTILTIVMAVMVAAVHFRPLKFSEMQQSAQISISYIESLSTNGTAKQNSKDYTYPANSEQFRAIEQLFKDATYHRRFGSSRDYIEGNTRTFVVSWGNEFVVIANVSDILVNGVVYRVGIFGDSERARLFEGLATVVDVNN